MKTVACSIIALVVATPVLAQTMPQTRPATGTDLTRMLNGAPPAPAAVPERVPATTPAPASTSGPTRPDATFPTTSPSPAASRPTVAAPAATAPVTRAPTAVAPVVSAPTTRAPSSTPVLPIAATPAPVPASPAPVPPTVLNAAAVAALPFKVELPTGFQITTGRPGPDFRVYTIRRGNQPFVMIYTGPASQFPIYTGETVQAAGRASVVTVEDGQRHAVEHLFQRGTAPTEVHIWVSSLEGADRVLAERIAQSVDVP